MLSNTDLNFLPLERQALALLLAGDHFVLQLLREQLMFVTKIKREYTGVGFFTEFEFDDRLVPLPNKLSFVLGDVAGKIEGISSSILFLLFVKSGRLSFLEGAVCGDDMWPEEVKGYSLHYIRGKRDLTLLEDSITKASLGKSPKSQ